MQLASFLATHLLAFALLAVTAWVAGRLATRRWIAMEGLERLAVPAALGLSLLAHAAFALAALGLLTRSSLIVLAAAIHLLGIPVWRGELGVRWNGRAALGVLVAVAPAFILTLYPPTGFDETLYHLPIARAFATTGSIPFLPDLRVPVFPSLNELLFAGMLLLADDVSTHLTSASPGPCCSTARPWAGSRRTRRPTCWHPLCSPWDSFVTRKFGGSW